MAHAYAHLIIIIIASLAFCGSIGNMQHVCVCVCVAHPISTSSRDNLHVHVLWLAHRAASNNLQMCMNDAFFLIIVTVISCCGCCYCCCCDDSFSDNGVVLRWIETIVLRDIYALCKPFGHILFYLCFYFSFLICSEHSLKNTYIMGNIDEMGDINIFTK